MKLNKKGFTLIEMLVIIAIIAILVAIIVPTVTSATNKAKAATDAANLRSALAEAEVYHLTNDATAHKDGNCTASTCYTDFTSKCWPGTSPVISIANGKFTATLNGYTAAEIGEMATSGEIGAGKK